jgi:hypothetical protein
LAAKVRKWFVVYGLLFVVLKTINAPTEAGIPVLIETGIGVATTSKIPG